MFHGISLVNALRKNTKIVCTVCRNQIWKAYKIVEAAEVGWTGRNKILKGVKMFIFCSHSLNLVHTVNGEGTLAYSIHIQTGYIKIKRRGTAHNITIYKVIFKI